MRQNYAAGRHGPGASEPGSAPAKRWWLPAVRRALLLPHCRLWRYNMCALILDGLYAVLPHTRPCKTGVKARARLLPFAPPLHAHKTEEAPLRGARSFQRLLPGMRLFFVLAAAAAFTAFAGVVVLAEVDLRTFVPQLGQARSSFGRILIRAHSLTRTAGG